MGKKVVGVIAFAAIAVVAGWNYQQNKQDVELSDLAMANVEALAEGEYDQKIWKRYYREDNTGYNCIRGGNETC